MAQQVSPCNLVITFLFDPTLIVQRERKKERKRGLRILIWGFEEKGRGVGALFIKKNSLVCQWLL
jgi:hypothetical protein